MGYIDINKNKRKIFFTYTSNVFSAEGMKKLIVDNIGNKYIAYKK